MHKFFQRFILGTITVVMALSFVLSAAAQPVLADPLIENAKVELVQNTSSNEQNFAIKVSDGTGPCKDKFIIFPLTGVVSPEVHARAYLVALAALNSDARIDVFDYSGASCSNGGQITIKKAEPKSEGPGQAVAGEKQSIGTEETTEPEETEESEESEEFEGMRRPWGGSRQFGPHRFGPHRFGPNQGGANSSGRRPFHEW